MRILKSIISTVIAIIVFILVTGGFEFLFRFLDEIRGEKFLLQEIWSSILAAILGSYFGMKLIQIIFIQYSRLLTLILFSTSMIVFLIWSLYYMIPAAEPLGFGVKEFSIQILTPVAAIITAFISLKNHLNDGKSSLKDYGITDDDFE